MPQKDTFARIQISNAQFLNNIYECSERFYVKGGTWEEKLISGDPLYRFQEMVLQGEVSAFGPLLLTQRTCQWHYHWTELNQDDICHNIPCKMCWNECPWRAGSQPLSRPLVRSMQDELEQTPWRAGSQPLSRPPVRSMQDDLEQTPWRAGSQPLSRPPVRFM